MNFTMVQVDGASVVKVSGLKLGWTVDIISFLAIETPAPTAGPPSDAPTSAPTAPTGAPTKVPTQVGETYAPTSAPTKAPTNAGATETPTSTVTLPPGAQAASADDVEAGGEATTAAVILSVIGGLLCALVVAVLVAIAIAVLIIVRQHTKGSREMEPRKSLTAAAAQSIQLTVPTGERLPSYEEANLAAIQEQPDAPRANPLML